MAQQHNSDFQDFHENLWPSGWYLYEGGQFVGPLSADEAFRERGHTPDGKPRLVSRKGFAQWYPVQDLASIYTATADAKEKSRERLLQAERELSSQVQTRSDKRVQLPDASARVQHKAVDPQSAKVRASGTATSVVPPHSRSKPAPLKEKDASQPVAKTRAASQTIPETKPSTRLDTPAASATGTKVNTQTEAQSLSGKGALMHEYFILKGRMRLGTLRNPWVAGFFNTIASLGVYWYLWFASAYKEVTWHCQNRERFPMPPAFLCLIPGVHFFMIYRLAQLVVDMEQQNKYQTISPALAIVYGVFPPFALTYLQDAINRHWMLHVRHSLARKS